MSQVLLRFLVSPCRVNLAWLPVVLCLGGFASTQILFYPGLISPDTFSQFNQIEEGIITDWHSPVMTYSWKLLRECYQSITGTTIPGNGILWTIYNGVLWGGLFLVLRSFPFFGVKTKHKSNLFVGMVLFILALFFGDCIISQRTLLKDIGLLGAYLTATGLLLNFPKNKWHQMFFTLTIFFFLSYGTAMRHNALFAVLPLLCWLAWSILPKKNAAMTVIAGMILWTIMLTGIHYVNYSFIKAERLYSLSEIFYVDIWQLNARTSHYVLPPNTFGNDFTDLDEKTFRNKFRMDKLFTASAFEYINGNNPAKYRFASSALTLALTSDQKELEERVRKRTRLFTGSFTRYYNAGLSEVQEQFPMDYQALKKAWFHRVLMDPITYLKFRTYFFIRFCQNPLWCGLTALPLLPILLLMVVYLSFSRNTFRSDRFPCLMLGCSALLYILPLWLFLPDDNPIRYLYWFFAASFISIAYFLAHSPLFAAILQTIQRYLEEKLQKE